MCPINLSLVNIPSYQIATHPDVADCAVIGIPDPKWVQSVKAIVVTRDGVSLTADWHRVARRLPEISKT